MCSRVNLPKKKQFYENSIEKYTLIQINLGLEKAIKKATSHARFKIRLLVFCFTIRRDLPVAGALRVGCTQMVFQIYTHIHSDLVRQHLEPCAHYRNLK